MADKKATRVRNWGDPSTARLRRSAQDDMMRLAELRHTLSFWLCAPGGGELVLPDEPEHAYRDALLVSAGAWSKLFSDGQCEITFTLFDPIAYGRERVERLSRFDVGGTWPALQDDVTDIDGNLSTAASVAVVESTVTEAIDDLDELGELEF